MCFFFFKQKTAYEMRISDWSSDVCSSDLSAFPADPHLSACDAPAFWDPAVCPQVIILGPAIAGIRGRPYFDPGHWADRKSVVSGKRVSVRLVLGGSHLLKKK